jgi:hypothetical protein
VARPAPAILLEFIPALITARGVTGGPLAWCRRTIGAIVAWTFSRGAVRVTSRRITIGPGPVTPRPLTVGRPLLPPITIGVRPITIPARLVALGTG